MLEKLFKPYMGLRREVYIIFIARVINALGIMVYPFMTLLLTTRMGYSGSVAGLLMSVGGVLAIPASLLGGTLSDRFGRKGIIILFDCLGCLGFISCMFLPYNELMVGVLMLSGILYAIAGPSHDAIMADLTDEDQRSGAYSLSYFGFNLGFAIAQIFAGFLFNHYLRLIFLVDAVTGGIAVILILLFVKETYDPKLAKARQKKANQVDESEDSIFKILLNRPILIYFAIAAFGYRFAYSQWQFLMPLHAEHNFPTEGAVLYGFMGSFNAALVVICTPVITLLFQKVLPIKKIILGGALFTVGFGLLGFISFKEAFFIAVFIFTLGEIVEAISSMPFIMAHTPETHRGRMSAILPFLMGLGSIIAPPLMGYTADQYGYAISWKIVGLIVGIATLLMVGVAWLDKERQK